MAQIPNLRLFCGFRCLPETEAATELMKARREKVKQSAKFASPNKGTFCRCFGASFLSSCLCFALQLQFCPKQENANFILRRKLQTSIYQSLQFRHSFRATELQTAATQFSEVNSNYFHSRAKFIKFPENALLQIRRFFNLRGGKSLFAYSRFAFASFLLQLDCVET